MSPEPQRDHGNSEGDEEVIKLVDYPNLALVSQPLRPKGQSL